MSSSFVPRLSEASEQSLNALKNRAIQAQRSNSLEQTPANLRQKRRNLLQQRRGGRKDSRATRVAYAPAPRVPPLEDRRHSYVLHNEVMEDGVVRPCEISYDIENGEQKRLTGLSRLEEGWHEQELEVVRQKEVQEEVEEVRRKRETSVMRRIWRYLKDAWTGVLQGSGKCS